MTTTPPKKKRVRKKAAVVELDTRVLIDRRLFVSVRNGEVDEVRAAIADGRDVNLDIDGDRPLHYAVRAQQLEVAEVLLDAGADPSTPGNFKRSPLHLATLAGSVELVRLLAARGSDLEARDCHDHTSLVIAAGVSGVEVIGALLAAGASIEARSADGVTPFLQAAACGNVPAAELLVGAGADPRAVNGRGQDALALATSRRANSQLSARTLGIRSPDLAAHVSEGRAGDVERLDRFLAWLATRR